MVTMNQFKSGVQKYLESEVMPALGGWQKWLFGAGAAMLLNRADTVIKSLESMPIVKAMDIIHGDKIDIDAVYKSVREQAKSTPAVIEIPAVGSLKMGVADIDKLYQMIMEG